MNITIYHYTAFSSLPEKGNSAAIIFDTDRLTDSQMQSIAQMIGFNETTFVCQSSSADLRLRFFTPGHEMALCGHATMATGVALHDHNRLQQQDFPVSLNIETQAGCLPIIVNKNGEQVMVTMRQLPARFVPFEGSLPEVADVLGLREDEIDARYPLVYGNTGIWTLLIPIRSLESFSRMEPENKRFPALLQHYSHASVHPFCLETYDPLAQLHGRHFSSPFSGTREDAVTGTASGAMGAYYIEYIQRSNAAHLLIEQGFEIERDGRVNVDVERTPSSIEVKIAGTATFVKAWQIEIE
ncbi:isomerase [Ktedonobacteria bacterium brp13]|nr:isomerase [Ktedonobacteria bacterium brp13]